MPLVRTRKVIDGASSTDEDQELATLGAGVVAEGGGPAAASRFADAEVRARFESGGLLLDGPRYKLDAGRRTGPGEVELPSTRSTSCAWSPARPPWSPAATPATSWPPATSW
jgi:hypothetical protein